MAKIPVNNGLKVFLIYPLLMCLIIRLKRGLRQFVPLGADIAIDLSGWTSNHFLAGFMARLAPIQVNYLGYFASSGLEEMDYWLGDHHLFPSPILEWSSENIVRLSRPFLAWKPVAPLPEAEATVSEAPNGPVRFGSFNHNRKMSDQTILLWGKILQAIPDAILVLKANASEDLHTQEDFTETNDDSRS